MVSKKMVSIFLAAGLLMSGCGKKEKQTKKSEKTTQTKQTEKGQTEDTEIVKFSVPSASETQRLHVMDENYMLYDWPSDFFDEYALEMIEEAKKQLPQAVQEITTYNVNVMKILHNNTKYSTEEKYEVAVDKIVCDVDSIKCMEAFIKYRERWLDGDSGLLLHLCVRVHVIGRRTDTGEMVDDTFLSTFLVSRMGMTMTMDGSEILDGGEIKCNFEHYLDTCFGYFYYFAFPDNITCLLDPDNLKSVLLWALEADYASSQEQIEFRTAVFSEYDKHQSLKIHVLDDYRWNRNTGLEDPYKADPSMGDGDDDPWDE